jgi:hypothetical protein
MRRAVAIRSIAGRCTRGPGHRPRTTVHDHFPADQSGLVGLLRRVGDNAIKTARLGLMKAARLQPGLKTALCLLIPCGAHRQLMFETMHMRDVATARPARQRKLSGKSRGIFLGHLRPAAFGSERRRGAVVLLFFDLHVCLVVWGLIRCARWCGPPLVLHSVTVGRFLIRFQCINGT